MASVKWLLLAFWEAYSFTLCCGKYFTLVFVNTDKRSSTMPLGVYPAQTNLHCAALCDMVPSCYSFTFSKTSLGDNCRLLPSTAISSTFTISDVGSKHYARKVDCSKCTVNYTMGMSSTNCILQQETPHASGWTMSDLVETMIVLNGNDQEFVATSSGCSTNAEFQCLHFYWYTTGPATLTVTAGSASSPTTYFTQTAAENENVNFERVKLDIPALHSSQVRFIGYKTKNTNGNSFSLGVHAIVMSNCPCSCIS